MGTHFGVMGVASDWFSGCFRGSGAFSGWDWLTPLPPWWGGCVRVCVCLGAHFCAVSDRDGGVFTLLRVIGGLFTGGWHDPPSPLVGCGLGVLCMEGKKGGFRGTR